MIRGCSPDPQAGSCRACQIVKLDRRASLLSSRLNFFLGLELRRVNTLSMSRAFSGVISPRDPTSKCHVGINRQCWEIHDKEMKGCVFNLEVTVRGRFGSKWFTLHKHDASLKAVKLECVFCCSVFFSLICL